MHTQKELAVIFGVTREVFAMRLSKYNKSAEVKILPDGTRPAKRGKPSFVYADSRLADIAKALGFEVPNVGA